MLDFNNFPDSFDSINGYQILSSNFIKTTDCIVSENPRFIVVHSSVYQILRGGKNCFKNLSEEQKIVLTKHKIMAKLLNLE
jgi:hypothetical protein